MSRGASRARGRGDVRRHAAVIDQKYLDFLETVPDAMVLSDRQGRIIWVNTNTERMFGYRHEELSGKEVEILVPERFRSDHRLDRDDYYANPAIRPMGKGKDLYASGKDGVEFPVEISLSTVTIRGETYIWSAIRHIHDRERALADLRAAFSERAAGLKGAICICAWCSKICDERGSWQQLEQYIESHSNTQFTHGICEDCLRKLDPARGAGG